MPKLGLTMEEGILVAWMVDLGQPVEIGQDLCEVETEKLTAVVESPFAGTLLRRVEPGDTIPVGQPIAIVGEKEEDVSSYALFSSSAISAPDSGRASMDDISAQSSAQGAYDSAASGKVTASPFARKLAAQLGVDLSTVVGTGPGGRITGDDVERATTTRGGADMSAATDPSP